VSGNVALIVGARGVIGGNLARHLERLGGWRAIGLSRRGGESTDVIRHVSVDLLDARDTRSKLADLEEVTHVFYAAYQDRPDFAALVEPNQRMLVNTLRAIEPVARDLRHVQLMQGYKVYGAHLGPFKTPAREDDPPHMPPEFNVGQQAFLEELQRGKDWTWSALRPSAVCGFALGIPMNLAMVIAVYATISAHLGIPLRFPGRPGAYRSLIEMTDAGLLAQAMVWAATDPAAANQAYNISNGDLFRWEEMWPRLAAYFGLPVAPGLPVSLATVMADKQAVWDEIIAKHDLAPTSYDDVSSWAFGDAVFSWDYDLIADGSKARRHGFHVYVDTAEMFTRIFDDMRARKIIPPVQSWR
jgi:nucleoside-diphosphate-sugar epimerase